MDPALWVVIAAAILSGFFALNSFSLQSFRRAKLEEVFSSSRGRRRLAALDGHLEALRLTLALSRSLANLLLMGGMVCLLGNGEGGWGHIIVAIAIAGAVIAVVGVAIPYAWSLHAGERVLAVTLPVLIALRYLLFPVIAVMQGFDLPVRRLSGRIDEDHEDNDAAKQEILQAASDGLAEGAVDDDEVEMIESVMEFGQTDTAAIMTPRTDIFALPDDMSWTEATRRIHEAGHTRVPIYRDNLDNITGIIYAKDLLKYVAASSPVNLEGICRKPFFVPETKLLDDLLREFKARKVHVAIVLDEYGGTAGLVSIEDVLEEIVGDIADEYDRAEDEQVRRIDETTIEVDGRLRVEELNDLLDLKMPEDEDYDTIAGFVTASLGHIPAVGEDFTANGAELTVLDADERKISKLRVRKLVDPEKE